MAYDGICKKVESQKFCQSQVGWEVEKRCSSRYTKVGHLLGYAAVWHGGPWSVLAVVVAYRGL